MKFFAAFLVIASASAFAPASFGTRDVASASKASFASPALARVTGESWVFFSHVTEYIFCSSHFQYI